jgi:hypothetical protein
MKFHVILFVFTLLGLVFSYPQTVIGDSAAAQVSIVDENGARITIVAIPEKRIPNVTVTRTLNLATDFRFSMYPAGADRTDDGNRLFTTSSHRTTDAGTKSYFLIPDIVTGTYDFVFKSDAHVSRILTSTELDYTATLDFTVSSTRKLLAGDINLTEGDNKINALDVSILVNNWGTTHDRADLNQDLVVNSLDISAMLTNFNVLGE